jgi:hypothetical protein
MTMTSITLARPGGRNRRITYQTLLDIVFAVWVFAGLMSVIEPSPYDFVALVAIPMWFVGGFKIHRVQALILILWAIFLICGFIALMPYWDISESRIYQLQTLYLITSVFCFTLYFGERTLHRAELCMKAYTFGAFVSALIGVLAFFHLTPRHDLFVIYEGRATGTFKDPNVFGSYLIPAIVFTFQDLLTGAGISRFISFAAAGVMILGVLLSYSRGSWGTAILAVLIMIFCSFVTAETAAQRRRIVIMTLFGLGAAILVLIAILSQDKIRELFFQRAELQQYDEGSTGRFGNQLHSIPMLLERPWGFGPLRFRVIFDLEPHNSYIGGFANDGWLGGLAWILIVLMTCFIGFRLMFVASPFRRLAQAVFPGLFALFLQAFQIDVDHWRQLYLFSGMIWGLEAARQRWRFRSAKPTAPAAERAPMAATAGEGYG